MSEVIDWQAPPRGGWGRWQRATRELQEKPGEWALILERVHKSLAWDSCRQQLRKAGCEVRVRKVVDTDDGYSVWARWPDDLHSEE